MLGWAELTSIKVNSFRRTPVSIRVCCTSTAVPEGGRFTQSPPSSCLLPFVLHTEGRPVAGESTRVMVPSRELSRNSQSSHDHLGPDPLSLQDRLLDQPDWMHVQAPPPTHLRLDRTHLCWPLLAVLQQVAGLSLSSPPLVLPSPFKHEHEDL